MAKQTYKILGQLGFNKYDELLRDKIKRGDEFVTTEQIDDLFPNDKPTLVSWSTGIDEEISAIINGYYNGSITLEEIQTMWSIGDIRNIEIEPISNIGNGWSVGESHVSQTVEIQILDFNHDELVNSINGKTNALLTVDLKTCLNNNGIAEDGYMHHSPYAIWENCDRRAWCNTGFYNALPSYIRELIKLVNKTTINPSNETIYTTEDYVFFLTDIEVSGHDAWSSSASTETQKQYALFSSDLLKSNYKTPYTIYQNKEYSHTWWQRTSRSEHVFYYVDGAGGVYAYDNANDENGIAPAFCL